MKSAALLIIALVASTSFAHVRNAFPKPDEIMIIKASIGIATIIQVPEAIQSAIIGDQLGFKVEYLNNAVTIKPLRYGVRTNLYLVTQNKRYNLRLLTVSQDQADFVVYVRDGGAQEHVHWHILDRYSKGDSCILHLIRVGRTKQGFILVEGDYTNEDEEMSPSAFWVLQSKAPKTISSLYLSKASGSRINPIHFSAAINESDLKPHTSTVFEVRGEHSLNVPIPESVLWH